MKCVFDGILQILTNVDAGTSRWRRTADSDIAYRIPANQRESSATSFWNILRYYCWRLTLCHAAVVVILDQMGRYHHWLARNWRLEREKLWRSEQKRHFDESDESDTPIVRRLRLDALAVGKTGNVIIVAVVVGFVFVLCTTFIFLWQIFEWTVSGKCWPHVASSFYWNSLFVVLMSEYPRGRLTTALYVLVDVINSVNLLHYVLYDPATCTVFEL